MRGPLLRRSATILLIWLAVTAPMAVLVWGVAPRLMAPGDPMPGLVFWAMIVIGMAWQMVLALIVLRLEGVPFRWADLRRRLWLTTPVWRATGRPFVAAFLLVPAFVAIGFFGDDAVTRWFEATDVGQQLADAVPGFAFIEGLATPQARGRWDILALAVVSCLFNYGLGEALLFHGVLLPRMERAWGRWAWLGNGLLFSAYHVHKFWLMPGLVISSLCYSLPAQVFRSNWLAIVIHGLEGVVLLVAVFLIVR
ncbi:MAG: CPBP family intramembrane metalloprotease [Caulobacteraceae bacterium]|nr:CPBP family intramembrane metalloprotease [Caulobacteraceae bacterium]